MFTQAEENYLKAIYALETKVKKGVSTNLIAEKMQTKASSVTDMIKRLSEKQLVDYIKYQGVQLTEDGQKVAVSIIRKHRLWECFLVDKLDFSWDEVHDIAEQLEHIRSKKLIDSLEHFLGYPTVDPHGDPIPDKEGFIYKENQISLGTLSPQDKSIITAVKDSSSDFLRYLDKKGIAIGNSIKVLSVELFDKTMEVEINGKITIITNEVASKLLVKELEYKF